VGLGEGTKIIGFLANSTTNFTKTKFLFYALAFFINKVYTLPIKSYPERSPCVIHKNRKKTKVLVLVFITKKSTRSRVDSVPAFALIHQNEVSKFLQ
jgi:hypothetical protein